MDTIACTTWCSSHYSGTDGYEMCSHAIYAQGLDGEINFDTVHVDIELDHAGTPRVCVVGHTDDLSWIEARELAYCILQGAGHLQAWALDGQPVKADDAKGATDETTA